MNLKIGQFQKNTILIIYLCFLRFFHFFRWFWFLMFRFSHFAKKLIFLIHKFCQWTQWTFLMIFVITLLSFFEKISHSSLELYMLEKYMIQILSKKFMMELLMVIPLESETHFSFRFVHFYFLFLFSVSSVHLQWFQSTFLFNHFWFHFSPNSDSKFIININVHFLQFVFLLFSVQK